MIQGELDSSLTNIELIYCTAAPLSNLTFFSLLPPRAPTTRFVRFSRFVQTVFILQIREAAAKTKDSLFTFGAGVDERQCAFKFAFQKLMGDLQVI